MKDWLEALAISVLAVFAPVKTAVIATGVLILADTVFGIWAAHKRGEAITSAGLRRTISKSVVYTSALLLGYTAEHFLIDDALPVSKIVAGLIGITESKSIFESLDTINGGSLFKGLINSLGSKNDNGNGA